VTTKLKYLLPYCLEGAARSLQIKCEADILCYLSTFAKITWSDRVHYIFAGSKTKIMKYLHLAVAALFALCAYWQLNDPDWNRWVAAYGVVAFIAIRYFFGNLRAIVPLLPALVLFGWWTTYVPEFTQWLSDGMPTITGSMKAESPHVELTREFLGLRMCGGAWAA
jgi:hypothetical protein